MTGRSVRIDRAGIAHVERWALMRHALWPDGALADHREDVLALLKRLDEAAVALLALDEDDAPVGFAEATLRHDYVNGCDTSPVLFLEGLFVDEAARGRGIGRQLVEAVGAWGRAAGCTEFASDADIANVDSHRFHAAAGFHETERVVYFRRLIG